MSDSHYVVNITKREKIFQMNFLGFLPSKGEWIEVLSGRDEKGNYLNKDKSIGAVPEMRTIVSGTVKKIEHVIEERGRNSQEWHIVHFIEIYLR